MKSLPQSNQSSPFDSIRHEDEDGEYWMGRELMPLLEYTKWQRFEDAIDRAKISCQVAGFNSGKHFAHLPGSVSAKGRFGDDFKLTRHACHLIAMNGDIRKTAIAQAQSYFSAKAYEAEVFIPAQNDRLEEQRLRIRELELQVELTQESRYLMEKREAIALMNEPRRAALILGAKVIEPPPEIIERTVAVDLTGKKVATFEGVGISYIVNRYGFRSNKEAWGWLESIGYGKEDKWIQELTAVQAVKLPRENIKDLDRLFQSRTGSRQMLLGE